MSGWYKAMRRLSEDHSTYAPLSVSSFTQYVNVGELGGESETERVLVRDERELLRLNRTLNRLEAKPLVPPGKYPARAVVTLEKPVPSASGESIPTTVVAKWEEADVVNPTITAPTASNPGDHVNPASNPAAGGNITSGARPASNPDYAV